MIPKLVRRVMLASAAEVYPYETYGYLVGSDNHIEQAIPVQQAERLPTGVRIHPTTEQRVTEVLDDYLVGDFHSHPGQPPVFSKISDFRKERDKMWSDEMSFQIDPFIVDGFIAVIISIWPGVRVAWRTLWSAYYLDDDKIRRGKIVWI